MQEIECRQEQQQRREDKRIANLQYFELVETEVHQFDRSLSHSSEHLPGNRRGIGTEEHPADTDEVEGHDDRNDVIDLALNNGFGNSDFFEHMLIFSVQNQNYTLIDAPYQEVHRRAVPESAKRHGDEQVAIGEPATAARTAQWDKQ